MARCRSRRSSRRYSGTTPRFSSHRASGRDATVGGIAIAEGDHVMTVLGAGNRDPRRFARPDTFDPLRGDGGPLSFGGGAHFCIGAALARLEASVAFPRLLGRFRRIAPAGDPVRRDTLLLRGFDALPVTVR
jgi:cytochrome P450